MKLASYLALFVIFAFASGSLPAQPATPSAEDRIKDLARDLTRQLAAGKFDDIARHFDDTMATAMPSAKLAEFWTRLTGNTGAYQSITAAGVQQLQSYQVVLVTTQFEKTALNLKWVFDDKSRVAGFFVVPVETASAWSAPDYAHPESFHEEQVTVGDVPWQLSGTLTMPNGDGPFPAVVLVAGSGPEDQDETILANKPFKDIAWGLASRGIAVLRYNKRTFQHASELKANDAGFTVNEEEVIDARAAVALLAHNRGIDPARIFVLGHSLGATLAPRIAQGDAQVAGLILLAGTTRPLEQVIVEQLKYIAGLNGTIDPEAQKRIDEAEQSAKEIESTGLKPDTRLTAFGADIPASYFLDLRKYRPAEVAAKLGIPMLILRGGRDYQVTETDMEGWKTALADKPGVTFKTYPGLYHLFMPSSYPGSGLGAPADYQKPGHVVQPAIEDIAAWIQARASAKRAS